MAASVTVRMPSAVPPVERGFLRLGLPAGASPALEVNSRYLMLDGRPWFPIMGEFHYARYPASEWEREILKMKAGGINIVATYVFWIHHEETEGKYDWSGQRELGKFIRLCGQLG